MALVGSASASAIWRLGDGDLFGHAVEKVAALDLQRRAVALGRRRGRADFLLDALGRRLADQKVLVAADIGDDGFVHLVAADAHRARIDDAAERQHGHFGRAAADIDDHRAGGLADRKAGADRGRHRFLDQEDAAGAGREGRFLNGAPFHRRRARRHADDDHRIGERATVMHFADEVLDHLLGDFEIGDHAVAHRPDRLDIAGGAPQHHLGVVADSPNLLLSAPIRHRRDHRWLVEDDTAPLHIDQRVRRTEINRHVARQYAEKTAEHACSARSFPSGRLAFLVG